MSAVLLECLFIDNARENKLLRDRRFLDGLAGAIFKGVAVAFGLKEKVDKPKLMYRVTNDGEVIYDTTYEDKIVDAVTKTMRKQAKVIHLERI